jgi:hypothetical protein
MLSEEHPGKDEISMQSHKRLDYLHHELKNKLDGETERCMKAFTCGIHMHGVT